MSRKRINDIFGLSTVNTSIFSALQDHSVPWIDENIQPSLDILYMGHSSQKWISPTVDYLLMLQENVGESADTLNDENFNLLIGSIFDQFNKRWQRLWDAYTATYDPITNYDLTENETIDTTETGTTSGTENVTNNATSTANAEAENNTGIYGFASSKQTSSDTTSATSDTTTTTSGTGETTRSGESSGTGNSKRNLTRSGNIGIHSNQELLQQEIDLWKWSFFETVFNDIDSVIALRVY